eukprot:Hpha_TRINITY_DN23829_c0_g1::TRINITY_DN23829_c0_g1_i1::g.109822::m.109822
MYTVEPPALGDRDVCVRCLLGPDDTRFIIPIDNLQEPDSSVNTAKGTWRWTATPRCDVSTQRVSTRPGHTVQIVGLEGDEGREFNGMLAVVEAPNGTPPPSSSGSLVQRHF